VAGSVAIVWRSRLPARMWKPLTRRCLLAGSAGCAGLLLPSAVRARRLRGPADLRAALPDVGPGEEIVLAGGDWGGGIEIVAHGTPDAPVVIRAEQPLGVRFAGPCPIRSSHLVLEGCGLDGGTLRIGGEAVRVTRWRIDGGTRTAVAVGAGRECRLDHCDSTVAPFSGHEAPKSVRSGVTTAFDDEKDAPPGLVVGFDRFHDLSPKPDPERHHSGSNHALRIGETGRQAPLEPRALVRFNLFERCHQNHGILGSETSGNRFLVNALRDPTGCFIRRNGWGNVRERNRIERAGGRRISDADHRLIGNVTRDTVLGIHPIAGDGPESHRRNGHPRTCDVQCIANDADRLHIGDRFDGRHRWPALHATVIGHRGPVVRHFEEDTRIVGGPVSAVAPAAPLSRADVGPDAP